MEKKILVPFDLASQELSTQNDTLLAINWFLANVLIENGVILKTVVHNTDSVKINSKTSLGDAFGSGPFSTKYGRVFGGPDAYVFGLASASKHAPGRLQVYRWSSTTELNNKIALRKALSYVCAKQSINGGYYYAKFRKNKNYPDRKLGGTFINGITFRFLASIVKIKHSFT